MSDKPVPVPCGAIPRADYLDRIRALTETSDANTSPDPSYMAMEIGVFGSDKPDDAYALMWIVNALDVPLTLERDPYPYHGSCIAEPTQVYVDATTYAQKTYNVGVIPAATPDMITFGFFCFQNSFATGTEGAVQLSVAPLLPNGFTIGWEKSYGNSLSCALSFEHVPDLEAFYNNSVDGKGHLTATAGDGTVVARTSIFRANPPPPNRTGAFADAHDFTLQTVLIEQT